MKHDRMDNPPDQTVSAPLYATFPRRLNALSVDALLLFAFSLVVFLLVPAVEAIPRLRVALAVLWWTVLLFYEPFCVWRFGGTLGHRVMNLRVANNRSDGNVALLTAIARFWIKGFLGIISFFSMNLSQRHQAVHDIVTGSSVRIANPDRAQPHHFTVGRTPPSSVNSREHS